MERDQDNLYKRRKAKEFQSTRSAWSATGLVSVKNESLAISIHALRMERDIFRFELDANRDTFQSTRSAWSATCCQAKSGTPKTISIHALRMERDQIDHRHHRYRDHFNPRAPHGARLCKGVIVAQLQNFNPRAPHGARLRR